MKKRNVDVVRAWRDDEYRNSLSEAERAMLPEHPVGLAEIDDDVLRSVTGGCCEYGTWTYTRPACSCVPPGSYCP